MRRSRNTPEDREKLPASQGKNTVKNETAATERVAYKGAFESIKFKSTMEARKAKTEELQATSTREGRALVYFSTIRFCGGVLLDREGDRRESF